MYRTPALTWWMHFCSVYGDGAEFPMVYAAIGALNVNMNKFNSLYLLNYLLQTMLIGAFFCYSLKSLFVESRPFFDDIRLADIGIKDCSSEFGSPSAHSLLACCAIPIFLWQMQEVFSEQLSRLKLLKHLTTFMAWFFIVSICYSRVYVGRHSFD